MYGKGAVTDQTCQKWFAKFYAGDFSMNGAPLWGRSAEADSNQIETLIEILYHEGDRQHTQNIQITYVKDTWTRPKRGGRWGWVGQGEW